MGACYHQGGVSSKLLDYHKSASKRERLGLLDSSDCMAYLQRLGSQRGQNQHGGQHLVPSGDLQAAEA